MTGSFENQAYFSSADFYFLQTHAHSLVLLFAATRSHLKPLRDDTLYPFLLFLVRTTVVLHAREHGVSVIYNGG